MGQALESITAIQPPFNMVVLVVLIVTIGGLLGGVAKQVRKFACHRQELEFKRELLDRGMGAEELERVVRVQGPSRESEA